MMYFQGPSLRHRHREVSFSSHREVSFPMQSKNEVPFFNKSKSFCTGLHHRHHEVSFFSHHKVPVSMKSFCTGPPDNLPPFRRDADLLPEFDRWCQKYGKTYASEEEKLQRLQLFEKNYEIVEKHNSTNSSYTLEVNVFAGLTDDEIKATYLGSSPPKNINK